MERAKKVTLVEDTPPVPRRKTPKKTDGGVLRKQKEALSLSPDSLVVDNSYPRSTSEQSLKSVKAAAYQVNSGERRQFPSDEYYAVWRKAPQDEDYEGPDVYQLLIGLRSHMKPEWEAIVNRAGSRRNKTGESSQIDGDPFASDADDEDDE